MIRRLRCYAGPLDAETDGLIVCYSQRQAETLLKIGKKKFADWWEAPAVPDWATKFVVYVRRQGKSIWNRREEA
jgi:hypothetical protein